MIKVYNKKLKNAFNSVFKSYDRMRIILLRHRVTGSGKDQSCMKYNVQ